MCESFSIAVNSDAHLQPQGHFGKVNGWENLYLCFLYGAEILYAYLDC